MATSFFIKYPSTVAGGTSVNIHDSSGNAIANGQQTMANSVPVVVASDQSNINTIHPDVTASGSITTTQSVAITVNGQATVGISITGTWTGTLTVEGSVDGTNYNSTTASFLASGQIVSNITSNALYQANTAGLVSFRIRGNTVGSGTATVALRASAGSAMMMLDNPLPAGSATIGAVTQASGPWTQNLTQVGGSAVTLGSKVSASSFPVVVASDQGAVPISAASLPLPAGAATAAKQPALGTAGTASADVITVQGIASMTALKVDGSAVTQPVSVASAIPTKAPVNTNGSIANTTLTGTTASTASAPANAVGFILYADNANSDNIRWCIGGTASATVGCRLEAGRDTGYIPCAANVSICAVASTTSNAFAIQWVLSA